MGGSGKCVNYIMTPLLTGGLNRLVTDCTSPSSLRTLVSGFLRRQFNLPETPKTETECSHNATVCSVPCLADQQDTERPTHKIKLDGVILTSWACEGVSTTATTHTHTLSSQFLHTSCGEYSSDHGHSRVQHAPPSPPVCRTLATSSGAALQQDAAAPWKCRTCGHSEALPPPAGQAGELQG